MLEASDGDAAARAAASPPALPPVTPSSTPPTRDMMTDTAPQPIPFLDLKAQQARIAADLRGR
ncbi:MAG: hypothetical protein J0H57_19430, partial [Rhodospirillales bacterium]|nr:hypothetical protein [Rhodospirillales bacterium]